jgi:hypothetical protein
MNSSASGKWISLWQSRDVNGAPIIVRLIDHSISQLRFAHTKPLSVNDHFVLKTSYAGGPTSNAMYRVIGHMAAANYCVVTCEFVCAMPSDEEASETCAPEAYPIRPLMSA